MLWQGNAQIVSTVVLSVGVIGFWGSLLFIRLSKKPEVKHHGRHISSERQKRLEGYSFSDGIRRWALVGLYAIPLLIVVGFGIYYYKINQPQTGITILVADFDGPDPQRYGVSQFIDEKIRLGLSGLQNVHVVILGEKVSAADGALKAIQIGQQKHATVVIWGWYALANQGITVTYHADLIATNQGLGVQGPLDFQTNFTAPQSRVETFDFQSHELPDNLIVDAQAMAGLSFESTGDYHAAIDVADAESGLPQKSQRFL